MLRKNISHQVINTNSKRLTLKYNQRGILIIRKPSIMSAEEVSFFVDKHMDWILKQNEISKPIVRLYENGEEYLYLGKKYNLQINENKHPGVFLQDNTMYVYVNDKLTPSKVVLKWKKEEAEKIFNEMLYHCFNKMNGYLDRYPALEIKKYKSRWGTCYPKKNKISLNISLIHTELEIIEFVVFHELAHFVHLNHSKDFHSFLRKFVPNEKSVKLKLKKYKCYYE